MIDISEVDNAVKAQVQVKLTGAPEHKADHMDRMILPDTVLIDYRYRTSVVGGWTEHEWVVADVRINGDRILKPGPKGEQRLGKDRHDARWYGKFESMPGWLTKLVEELRPSGDLSLTGDVS